YLHDLRRHKKIIGAIVLVFGILMLSSSIFVKLYIAPVIEKVGIIEFIKNSGLRENILFTVFKAGFPLGAGITIIGAAILSDANRKRIWWYAWLIILVALIISIIPKVFGDEYFQGYYGISGIIITSLFLLFSWFWSRNRHKLDDKSQIAADLKMAGYLFFLLASWQFCSLWGMPIFLSYPEKTIQFHTLPLAIGQTKLIMAFFIIGWAFTVIGYNYNNRINIKIRKFLKKTKLDENDKS
ncbi:hypothetical protein ACFLTE_10580, partial [Bacteroidota bacterium]